jgi:hypothetical protein
MEKIEDGTSKCQVCEKVYHEIYMIHNYEHLRICGNCYSCSDYNDYRHNQIKIAFGESELWVVI